MDRIDLSSFCRGAGCVILLTESRTIREHLWCSSKRCTKPSQPLCWPAFFILCILVPYFPPGKQTHTPGCVHVLNPKDTYFHCSLVPFGFSCAHSGPSQWWPGVNGYANVIGRLCRITATAFFSRLSRSTTSVRSIHPGQYLLKELSLPMTLPRVPHCSFFGLLDV